MLKDLSLNLGDTLFSTFRPLTDSDVYQEPLPAEKASALD